MAERVMVVSVKYVKVDGQYFFDRNGQQTFIGKVVGLLVDTLEHYDLADKMTLIDHGRPEKIKAHRERIIKAFESDGFNNIADDIRIIACDAPAPDINKAINDPVFLRELILSGNHHALRKTRR